MRIPSQFNEDNLYRRVRRRQGESGSYRRLIRLVLGLALVVVVMGQVSREGIYEPFFGSQEGGEATETAGTGATASAVSSTSPANRVVPQGADDEIALEDQRIASALVTELAPSDRRQWTVLLSRWNKDASIGSVPSTIHSMIARLDSLDGVTDQRRESWKAALEALQNDDGVTKASQRNHMAVWLAALDEEAFSRVVDGSVWRGGDFDAFYRYLDQADQFSETGVATVGVVSMLQQPDVFRGGRVRIAGSVARAEQVVAKENDYGVDSYWQLWLRPSDGADRPFVAIVRQVPDSVSEVGADATLEEGPAVTLVGKFLKRLAYPSSAGAELAPVIVGRLTRVPTPQDKRVDSQDDRIPNQFWLTLLVACGVGVALAALTMWRTKVVAERTRQMRASLHSSDNAFLHDIDGNGEEKE